MALLTVDNFVYTTKNNKIYDKTIAEYSTFYNGNDLYFQIDTYGTKTRENPDKVSQSIQIDKKMAQYLIDILKEKFNLE